MGKRNQSFLDALLGSFKKTSANDSDDFYAEEGNFDEFKEIKGAKKYSKQEVLGEETTNTKRKKTIINKKRVKKETKETNDFEIEEESNAFEASNFEEVKEENDSLLNKLKKNIKFVVLISALIILLIVVLIIQGCTIKDGKLTSISTNIPNVIYLNEQTEFSVTALGRGNLNQTRYKFGVTNEGIVELLAKGQLIGKKVTNKLIPLTTGKFAVTINSELGKTKLKQAIIQVVICKKLTKDSLSTEDGIIVEVGKEKSRLNLDIGNETECYQALNYETKNKSIVTVSDDGYLTAKKAGDTTITITDGETTITNAIHVRPAVDLKRVAGIKLDKTSTSIFVGDTQQITATIVPDTATNKSIKWFSNNEGVVTVSNKGQIKGIGQGVAVITAETEDNKQQAMVIVTVKNKQENPVDTTPPSLTRVNIVSNNAVPTVAEVGNNIILTIESNQELGTKPAMYINNNSVSVTCESNMKKCIGTLAVTKNISKGKVTMKIVGYKNKTGNTGNEITNTTDGSSVTIYQYSNWSNPSEKPCDINQPDICKTTTLYSILNSSTSSYAGAGACNSGDTQIGTVCNKDGAFLHDGACGGSDCAGATSFCTNTPVCQHVSNSWSAWSTTACNAGPNCKTTTGYQTRTRS